MKLPISDKFLWEIYKFFEPTMNNADILSRPRSPYKLMFKVFKGENPAIQRFKEKMRRQKFNRLMFYLKKSNLIKVKNLESGKAIMITKKGVDRILKNRFKLEPVNLKKRKDGKWIMIIFDIPKNHNKSRGLLRSILQNLGYKMFQHSVWVTPYDVIKKTESLLQWYSLDNYVRIFLIEKL